MIDFSTFSTASVNSVEIALDHHYPLYDYQRNWKLLDWPKSDSLAIPESHVPGKLKHHTSSATELAEKFSDSRAKRLPPVKVFYVFADSDLSANVQSIAPFVQAALAIMQFKFMRNFNCIGR